MLHQIEHPLAEHYLTLLRDKTTSGGKYADLVNKITEILLVEATRQLETTGISINTPLDNMNSKVISESIVVLVVLRAGLGMLPAAQCLLPISSVSFLGLQRDEKTAKAQ